MRAEDLALRGRMRSKFPCKTRYDGGAGSCDPGVTLADRTWFCGLRRACGSVTEEFREIIRSVKAFQRVISGTPPQSPKHFPEACSFNHSDISPVKLESIVA